MEGWIKLHRKLLDWEWFNDSEMVHLFIYLLLKANHTEKKWKGVTVKRGQLITGYNVLSNDLGISIKILRNRIDKLVKTGELGRQTGNQFSIITINNYESYQPDNSEQGKPMGNQRAGGGQTVGNQRAITKNEKKIKNEKKFIKPTPDEVKIYCKERNRGVNPVKWFNHYESNGWRVGKNPMKNWKAAVHTWEDSDIQTPGKLPESKGSNLGGSKLPADYGKPSSSAVPMPKHISEMVKNIGKK